MGVYHQIKDKFIMRNARADWASYRDQLTDLILQMYPETVMIVGAGRCNDIDLGRLVSVGAERCNDNDPGRRMSEGVRRVVLLDVDADGMQEAAASLPEEQRSKLELRTGSLTGISEDDMETFCDRMLSYVRSTGRDLSVEYVRRELMEGMDNLKGVLASDMIFPEDHPDLVVCCGVHSQLFSTLSFFVRSLLHSLKDILPGVDVLEGEVSERIRRMNDQVIPGINRTLYKAAGKCVIFGNEFMPEHPVEGAHQCILDVREHYRPEEAHLTWEFNKAEGITYDMLIQICRV